MTSDVAEVRAREVLAKAYESYADPVRAYEVRNGGHQLHVDAMLAFRAEALEEAVAELRKLMSEQGLNASRDHVLIEAIKRVEALSTPTAKD